MLGSRLSSSSSSAELLASRKHYFKRTRRGKVVRVISEKYLRNDTGVGFLHGKQVDANELKAIVGGSTNGILAVVDTNIAFHHIDILEHDSGVFLCTQTVLNELRNLNISVFRRLMVLMKDESKSLLFLPNETMSSTACARCVNCW